MEIRGDDLWEESASKAEMDELRETCEPESEEKTASGFGCEKIE